MASPRRDLRDWVKSIFGKPGKTLPYGSTAYPRVVEERTARKVADDVAFLTPHPDDATLKLISQNTDKGDNTDAVQTLVYEKIPGILLSGQIQLPNGQIAIKQTQKQASAGAVADSGALIEQSEVEPEEGGGLLSSKTTLSVDSVFPQSLITYTQPFTMPDEYLGANAFRETIVETLASTDTTPDALGTGGEGVTESTAEQIRVDRIRYTTKTQYGPFNATVTNFKRSDVGQVITETKTINLDGTAPTLDALTVLASVTAVGGDYFEHVTGVVPDVFPGQEYSVEIPDIVPAEFKAAIPTVTTSSTVSGTPSSPTLGTGDLSKSEKAETEFTKRVSVTNRSTNTTTFTNIEWSGEYGGAFLNVQRTLANGTPAAPGGSLTSTFVSFDANNLGNGQTVSIRKDAPAAWPLLGGIERVTTNRLLMKHVSSIDRTTTKQTVNVGGSVSVTWLTVEATVTPVDSLHSTVATSNVSSFTALSGKARDARYNGALTTTTETILQTGATPPALGAGVVESRCDPVDTLRVLQTVVEVDGGTFPDLTGKKFVTEIGATANVIDSKGYDLPVVPDGTDLATIISAEVQQRPDGVDERRIVSLPSIASFPVLLSSATDPFLGIVKTEAHRRVAPGTQTGPGLPGISYTVEPRGSYSILTTRRTPIPRGYSYPKLVSVALPRVLKGIIQYLPPNAKQYQNYGQYKSGGVVHVMGRVDVRFTTNPQKPVIETAFVEEGWEFPGFSGNALTNGETFLCVVAESGASISTIGDVSGVPSRAGAFIGTLPRTKPTSRQWLENLGRELVNDYHCEPWEAQIWREETTYVTLPV